MGLNLHSIRLLFESGSSGVFSGKTLTLGRQFFACHPQVFARLAGKYGYAGSEFEWVWKAGPKYADDFLRMLGSDQVTSMDFSGYEGAELVHDMNKSIDQANASKYDVVLDGGTLEHIFNVPVAIKNLMDLVRVGGRLLLITPINNFCGHGFYQFSPEFFYRVFSERNGFAIERAILWEENGDPVFFSVRDPAEVKRRIELSNRFPIHLFVQAVKLRSVEQLVTPQQSDYVTLWDDANAGSRPSRQFALTRAFSLATKLLRPLYLKHPRLFAIPLIFERRFHVYRNSLNQKLGFRRIGKLSPYNDRDRLE